MAKGDADRIRLIEAFLDSAGWQGAHRTPLAGDASFRRYERLSHGSARAVLMDAPPIEDVRPFVALARHLNGLGLSAPRILAADEAAGLLVIEDLGDETYTRVLAKGADEAALYALAVDVLVDLHRRPASEALPAGLPSYDDERLLDEALLLLDWYLPTVSDREAPATLRDSYATVWRALFPIARAVPESLVLRDYHVDNLMWLPAREGTAACGLLDFQDGVTGPVSYDLVSLLEDARRDIDSSLIFAMLARYLAAFPALDQEAFAASYAVLGAQRHAKVIGIFTRLSRRDGKDAYLEHIPRVWRLFEGALAHPALEPMRAWIDANIPVAERKAPPCRPAA